MLEAQVHDSTGTPCIHCPAGDKLSMVGVVHNPCSEDYELTTRGSCLANYFELIDMFTGAYASKTASCGSTPTVHTIPAGGSVSMAYAWGVVPTSHYTLTVGFDYGSHPNASVLFALK